MSLKNIGNIQSSVPHTCNPSYWGGRDQKQGKQEGKCQVNKTEKTS
jgi:hypothetical protein